MPNNPKEATSASVVSIIMRAFSNVPYPGDHNIFNAITTRQDEDAVTVGQDEQDILSTYSGRSWQDIPVSELRSSFGLPYFTPTAYHYFLQAFLIGIVGSYLEADIMVGLVIMDLSEFLHTARGKGTTDRKTRYELLSREQRTAILAFLNWLVDFHLEDRSSRESEKLTRLIKLFES